ncbi:MAG: TlpA family protein disulfide reductase [Candidatus Omnitrophica bacterium]|nr:TlpA family protein disulfide reductase [Candidatus Omnitrophota bacterium]
MKKMLGLIGLLILLVIGRPHIYGQTKAPDFTLTTIDGKEIKLSDYKGKKVIINFWATNCPPCLEEIPDFVKFYNQNKKKVEIIGIAVGKTLNDVKRIVSENKITYPVCMSDGKVENLYGGIRWVPTTFIIDEKGYIQTKKIGKMDEVELNKILE